VLALLVALATASVGCAHTQPPERKVYVISEDASGVGSNVERGTGGAGAEAYCSEMEKQCFKKCWRRKPKIDSIPKGKATHHEYCTTRCREEFNKCLDELEERERQESQKELHFPTMDAAINWLREHKTEVAVGTVVIVAGVIAAPYVVAIAAGGALILAPL
jgi:hypothetical protein